jgi:GPH family glycoside/pentoside/hexuronide:cation symporter
VNEAPPLPRWRRYGYGFGDVGFNIYFTTAGLYLLYYYTDVVGLSAATAGWISGAALVWDAFCDPLMGYLASRTRTRWGRYRPYILFGTVPLAASWVLMFLPTGLEGAALIVFTLAAQILFRTLYTIVSMPFLSLSAAMTSSSAERGQLAAARMVCASGIGLLVAFFTLKLAAWLGQGDDMAGFLRAAILYGSIGIVAHLVVFFTSTEDPLLADLPRPDITGIWRMLRGNRPFWIVAGWMMLGSSAQTIFTKTFPYYFKYAVNRPEMIGSVLALSILCSMLSIPVWEAIMRRTSKSRITVMGFFVIVAGGLAFAFAGTNLAAYFAVAVIVGFGNGAGYLAFWAMVPDTVEYGEWQTGVRAEGMVFGLISFIQKAALGVAVIGVGQALSAAGYVANQPQSPQTLEAMRDLMIWAPIILGGLGVIIIRRYPIDKVRHAELVAAIAARA